MLTIDGSYGEGGGQILRTSLSLSAITGTAIRVRNVRINRKSSGLSPQHLTALRALGTICDARTEGAHLGATEVTFHPRTESRPGRYTFDVAEAAEGGSAGSAMLLFQTLLLPLAVAEGSSDLTLRGGTHVAWSPSFDYVRDVYLPTVSKMGIPAECRLRDWGFYPAGGGSIDVHIGAPSSGIRPCRVVDRGDLETVRGRAVASNLPSHIPQRMVNRATSLLRERGLPTSITAERVTGAGPGAGIFLTLQYADIRAGFSALGEPGKPSEKVAEEVCRKLFEFHATGAPVDKRLADQLMLPAALAQGRSTYHSAQLTSHLTTNAHIINQFFPGTVEIEGPIGSPGTVTIDGSGPLV